MTTDPKSDLTLSFSAIAYAFYVAAYADDVVEALPDHKPCASDLRELIHNLETLKWHTSVKWNEIFQDLTEAEWAKVDFKLQHAEYVLKFFKGKKPEGQ